MAVVATWTDRRTGHEQRVDAAIGDHRERRRTGETHPVEDFLFTYYSLRPAQLRRWHPGWGGVLDGSEAEAYLGLRGYQRGPGGVGVSTAYATSQRPLLIALQRLLRATSTRPAQFGCFGLHEWAMVYGEEQTGVRHSAWPLRLGREGTDAVVERHRIACTHFDAYRFFTPPAQPLNVLSPSHDNRADFEQPGCLHAGMDLYKHAGRLLPLVSSELVMDCFDLAREIRVLDMRASPYDFRALGYEPVAIETSQGKQTYADGQRAFTVRAAPLRQRLLDACDELLADIDTP
ncbi:MAG TPA: 3-methyladenine DNA glycosylase [Propionibacteriaceae bacterium]